ncbi:MAG: hypothetical protein GXP55_12400, partial [Deltaproteobacteria bacterium]|nr:hypothetical protein [Deltaproteobacteria bacterium]
MRIGVRDVGVLAERVVSSHLVREFQDDSTGEWVQLAATDVPALALDGAASDPDNFYYEYSGLLADGSLFVREGMRNERVRITTRVTTEAHTVEEVTTHEIGMPVATHVYWAAGDPAFPEIQDAARHVYYGAADQDRAPARTGALVGAWSTQDPMRLESGLGNLTTAEQDVLRVAPAQRVAPVTGLLLAEASSATVTDGAGNSYLDSADALSDIFVGTITELYSDENFVLASKSGVLPGAPRSAVSPYVSQMQILVDGNAAASAHLLNDSGELLVFTHQDGPGSFGVAYLLRGRIDMPYPDVYGVARKDDLALVANGNGGVQVIGLSDLSSPYHVGFIKPFGFARDVVVHGDYAVIAASSEGVVIADLRTPSMPIIASVDTLGIANRISIEGNLAFVTDMAGAGRVSQVSVIDLTDPFRPELLRTIDVRPARPDYVADGAYDVLVSGGKAYVTVHYSDQEDQPSQSVLEVIDLVGSEDPTLDASEPGLVHEAATAEDFGARGIVLARGGAYVAGGRQGLARFELPSLTVLSTDPGASEDGISTALDGVTIELSGALPDATTLRDWVMVQEIDPTLGEDVTDLFFDVAFLQRAGSPDRRFIELRRKPGIELESNMQYFVTLRGGLAPLTGLPLANDYVFNFISSRAGSAVQPDIISVSPASGSVAGGTSVVVCGHDFGPDPDLTIGGQRHRIDQIVPAGSEGPGVPACDELHVSTLPNEAGPAAVQVTTAAGLTDTALGAFVYADLLEISFLDPAVVSVAQLGAGDTVDVVGYGFTPGTSLRAWKSGQPDTYLEFTAGDGLSLFSGERMAWTVPDFGGSYRGFVDVEIRDLEGGRFLRPNALFYGRLVIDRVIDEEPDEAFIAGWVPDANRLPPGQIMDVEVDSDLGLVYVLAQGPEPGFPGYLTLVQYDPAVLGNAAPRHALGYYNTPVELAPTAMTLGASHVYVGARGQDLDDISTPMEGRTWILTYDRETDTAVPGGEDRQFIDALPLSFAEAPTDLVVKDDLLFAADPGEGLAVISLADPARPAVIRVIRDILLDGRRQSLSPLSLDVHGSLLHVGRVGNTNHVVFDISRPTMPLVATATLGASDRATAQALVRDQDVVVSAGRVPSLSLEEVQPPAGGRPLGEFQPRGFALARPAHALEIVTLRGLSATVSSDPGSGPPSYVTLFGIGDPAEPQFLDAVRIEAGASGADVLRASDLSDDGVFVGATDDRVLFVDTLIQDLAGSSPAPGDVGVPTTDPVRLQFTRPLDPGDLSPVTSYIDFIRDDGTPAGVAVAHTVEVDPADSRVLVVTPSSTLLASETYELRLRPEPASRRAAGLFSHRIAFTTATDASPRPEIVGVSPSAIPVTGGTAFVEVRNADASPVFLVAGVDAPVVASTDLGAGATRFELAVPANLAGPAAVSVLNPNGGRADRLGALRYMAPLRLASLAPERGSVNGGLLVTIHGEGFRGTVGEVSVSFGAFSVPPEDIHVIDGETLEVLTPPGILGTVDVTVQLTSGQVGVLPNAFQFQEPLQSSIHGAGGRVYDMVVDPSGAYLVTASGAAGVVIWDIDPSSHPLATEEDRRTFIDEDGDHKDDRIVAEVSVPGMAAYGVDTYFERGVDRVIVAGAAGGPGREAGGRLAVLAFDPLDITRTSVVDSLALDGTFARGVDADNGRALVAMGDAGVGLVDIHLPGEAYLTSHTPLPAGHHALDVVRLDTPAGTRERYAATSGGFDFEANALVGELDPSTGAFYLLEHGPGAGFVVTGSVPVPASRVAIGGDFAYLAAGLAGLVVVDISDVTQPVIVRRLDDLGAIYDVALNGDTLYVALGAGGIVTLDVTDPARPSVIGGMESVGNDVRAVAAGDYAAIGGGDGAVQVSPDVVLKVFRVDPTNRIVDRDALDRERVIVRFNKAIDDWPANIPRFHLLDAAGAAVSATVEIINNDAILTLDSGHALHVGDALQVVVDAGVESVKLISPTEHITLYTLPQAQQFELTYRGARPTPLVVDSVVPRRVLRGHRALVSISAAGLPLDASAIRVFVGAVEASVRHVESTSTGTGSAVLVADLPALPTAGQYDVTVRALHAGVWEEDTLSGGLVVDAPLHFGSITPAWGPQRGGTVATILGEGFDPGTTVSEALDILIGDTPVRSVRVLSTTRLQVETPGGRVGRNAVRGSDRYGNEAELSVGEGFGYGLRALGQLSLPFAPNDIVVDQQAGVAVTSGGSLEAQGLRVGVDAEGNFLFPSGFSAATIDVQDPLRPLFVGAAGMLRKTPEELAALEVDLDNTEVLYGDSVGVLPYTEIEDGVPRQRLYVASGNQGVVRLNLDEANGLRFLSSALGGGPMVGDLDRSGDLLLAAEGSNLGSCRIERSCEICGNPVLTARVRYLSMLDADDPVLLPDFRDADDQTIAGSTAVRVLGDWAYAGGTNAGWNRNNNGACAYHPSPSLHPDAAAGLSGSLQAINLFEPDFRREYSFGAGNVLDLVPYGDYLIVALGAEGLVVVRRDDPSVRAQVGLTPAIQANAGPIVRLRLLGSTLFASSLGGSFAVYDLSDPLAPRLVSAGNTEQVQGLDYFNGRLLTVSGDGLTTLDLPGAFVADRSIPERGFMDEAEAYELTFSEAVTEASLAEPGAVTVRRLDTDEDVAFSLVPLDSTSGSAQRFSLDFAREGLVEYEIRVTAARTLRSGSLWVPFLGHVRAATPAAQRPVIHRAVPAVTHRGDNAAINIEGAGFRDSPDVHVFVDGLELSYVWVDANTLTLPAGAFDLLEPGAHHLRVVDQELVARRAGAVVVGEDPSAVEFSLPTDSGPVEGGVRVSIEASGPAILPGAKVILRAHSSALELRTEFASAGTFIRNLEDDVESLTSFSFLLPGVAEPDLFDVFLSMAGKEVPVGSFSYALSEGRSIDLPNYPPMTIGAAELSGDLLYVGVKSGAAPTSSNRFLMQAGLEIYDVSIWDRPLRLAQLPMEYPVTGIAVDGPMVYLASGADGLVVVAAHDVTRPLRIANFAVPGGSATDLAFDRGSDIIALSVVDGVGGGFVRFFDSSNPAFDPPMGYGTISFSSGDLAGQPVDVAWLDGELYVLFVDGAGALRLAVFSGFPGTPGHALYEVSHAGRVSVDASGDFSMLVQHGQIVITSSHVTPDGAQQSLVVLERNADGGYDEVYWRDQVLPSSSPLAELIAQEGAAFIADAGGMHAIPTPNLVVTRVSPPSGTTLVAGETIRVRFNQLIDTSPGRVAAGVQLLDSSDAPLPATEYTLDANNTLEGGYVDVALSDSIAYRGPLRLAVTSEMKRLTGEPLHQPVYANYEVTDGVRPSLTAVLRDGAVPLFHADGSETAVALGANFGADASALSIVVGDVLVPSASLALVSDAELHFTMPAMSLALRTTVLDVTILRDGVPATLDGAVIIQPAALLQVVNPATGPPTGGNRVDLFGEGLSDNVRVTFGGAVAGDLEALSAGHLRVRAPAGSLGAVDVALESTLFEGEGSVLPGAYFYTNPETGSVDTPDGSPVAAIAVRNQLLFAVTGGSYEVRNTAGEVVQTLTTTTARLVLSDLSDPVRPTLVEDTRGDSPKPYHLEVPLAPDGFRALSLAGDHLYLLGGSHLFNIDITVPTAPTVIEETSLFLTDSGTPDVGTGLLASGDLLFVSAGRGVRIYRLGPEARLEQLALVPADSLGGVPGQLALSGDVLWAAVPEANQMVAIDLVDGDFGIVERVATTDRAGNPIRPSHLVARDDLLLVSSGQGASVVAFQRRPGSPTVPVAQLALVFLTAGTDINAGQLELTGQTLYVASGDGDVQVFDVSPWLADDFATAPTLRNYFAVPGAVHALALGRGAVYAGTTYVVAGTDPTPRENPLSCASGDSCASGIDGAIVTLGDTELAIVDQSPSPGAAISPDGTVEVQFNRILDPDMVSLRGDELFVVSRGDVPIAGFVSGRVTPEGTRLVFRPASAFAVGAYSVRVSEALADLRGDRLSADYTFPFRVVLDATPVLDEVTPRFGSWRGGEEVILSGSGFGAGTTASIGGVPVAEVRGFTSNSLTVVTPEFASAEAADRLVGVEVSNGEQSDFAPAAFTYVSDPLIHTVGVYDSSLSYFRRWRRTVRYNGGELIGLEGEGFGPLTTVAVNGHAASDVALVRPDLLVFSTPGQTIGSLTIEVSNGAGAVAENREMQVVFEPDWEATACGLIARDGGLVVTGSGASLDLASARDSELPSLLAHIDLPGLAREVALQGGYLVARLEGEELVVYDLTDLYAPEQVNRVVNAFATPQLGLVLSGTTFVTRGTDEIHVGSILGAGWETLAVPGLIDHAVEGDVLYLLLADGTLEARDLHDPSTSIALPVTLDIVNAKALSVSPQRLVVMGEAAVQIFLTGNLAAGGQLSPLGTASGFTGLVDASMSGELLATIEEGGGQLQLYDVNRGASSVSLEPVARLDSYNASEVHMTGGWLSWRTPTVCKSLSLPLSFVHEVTPTRIQSPTGRVRARLAGDRTAFAGATLSVREVSMDHVVSGSATLGADSLDFAPVGESFERDATYEVTVGTPPTSRIDGGTLTHDLSWIVRSAPLFGVADLEVATLSPATVVQGAPTSLTMRGVGLDAVTAVDIGGVSPASFALNADATEISFVVTMPTLGVFTATVSGGAELVHLPAALVVTAPVAISSITTDSPAGPRVISDAGGTQVSVAGAGIEGQLELYLPITGSSPSAINRVAEFTPLSDGLRFASPPCIAGATYDVVVNRVATGDSVSELAAITCQDDSPPRLIEQTAFRPTWPLSLRYDELVAGASLAVSALNQDYLPAAPQDVTSRFALTEAGDTVRVALRPGELVEDNHLYTFTVAGVADLAGNLANSGTPIVTTYQGRDTLPPRDVGLTDLGVRVGPGQPVSSLVVGRHYDLVATANENLGGPVAFSVRVSRDLGLSFGPPSTSGTLSVDVVESDVGFVFRVEARDAAGNVASQDVSLPVSAPDISVAALGTDPAAVEERTRTTLTYRATGSDVNLVTRAEMRIFSHTYAAQVTTVDPATRDYWLRYEVPTLADVQAATLGSSDIPVTVTLFHGSSGTLTRSDTFTVHLDTTPPTVAVVSPVDGAAVPVGERVDLRVRTFDAYGVDRVEVAVDGAAPVVLSDPTLFAFTPATTTPVSIEVAAYDPAGNRGSTTITLSPFDGDGEAPRLAILSPGDGDTLRERQSVQVEVELSAILDAELALDLGGDEANPLNPAPISLSRLDTDPERMLVPVTLPSVPTDGTLVLRLTYVPGSGPPIVARRLVNILNDESVSEAMALTVTPAATVLGGSELWVAATAPDGMEDFSDASTVQVEDPAGTSMPSSVAIGVGLQQIDLAPGAATVDVVATLRDLSGNENVTTESLTKLAYLAGATTTVTSPDVGERVIGAVTVPAVVSGDEAVWATQRIAGGWDLLGESGAIDSAPTGSIARLSFTGSGLLAEVDDGSGGTTLCYWPMTASGFGPARTTPFDGELLGGSGSVAFTRHGHVVDGVDFGAVSPVALAGAALAAEPGSLWVDGDRLFVLSTLGGLSAFSVSFTDVPHLEPIFHSHLGTATGFRVSGEQLVSFSGGTLRRFRLLTAAGGGAEGELLDLGSVELGGTIRDAFFDGDLLWVRIQAASGSNTWHVLRGDELVALRSGAGDLLVWGAQRQLERTPTGDLVAHSLAAQSSGDALSIIPEEHAHGVAVVVETPGATLGGDFYALRAPDGSRLPAAPVWTPSGAEWFVTRAVLSGGQILVDRHDRGGIRETATTPYDTSSVTSPVTVTPAPGETLAQGALAPVHVVFGPATRVTDAQASFDGSAPSTMALAPEDAAMWFDVPAASSSAALAVTADGVVVASGAVTVAPNAPGSGVVLLDQPTIAQEFVEGAPIRVDFHAPAAAVGPFRFAEVRLTDSAGAVVARHLVTSPAALLSFSAPPVVAAEAYGVSVRAYYGPRLDWLESVPVPVQVRPGDRLPEPAIGGVADRVMLGSRLVPVVLNPPAAAFSRIEVRDDTGVLLATGETSAPFVVPATTADIRVTATFFDGLGATRSAERRVEVVPALTLAPDPTALPFTSALPGVGGTYFAQGRSLFLSDGAGVVTEVARLDADITALAYLGGRVAVGLGPLGLVILDPQDGHRVVSEQSVGNVTAMVVREEELLLEVDGVIVHRDVLGMALGAASAPLSVYGSALTGLRGGASWYQYGTLPDTRYEGFALLTDQGLFFYQDYTEPDSGLWRPRIFPLTDRVVTAFAVERDALFALTADGDLLRFSHTPANWYGANHAVPFQTVPLGVTGERLLTLAGDLLALDPAGEATLIDTRDAHAPTVEGRFPIDLGGDVSH